MGGVCGPDNCPWLHHQIVAADQRKMEPVGSIELPSLAKLESSWKNCNVGSHVGFVAEGQNLANAGLN
jgi:hypothetical protein